LSISEGGDRCNLDGIGLGAFGFSGGIFLRHILGILILFNF
jgi:hypothetical protein